MEMNPKESFADKIYSNVIKKEEIWVKEEKRNAWSFIYS